MDSNPRSPVRRMYADTEIAAIEKWIDLGAPWPAEAAKVSAPGAAGFYERIKKEHWAYQPVVSHKPPETRNGSRSTHPVDRFVLAALEKAGLRVSDLDLIEANEAFAAQSVAVGKELGFDRSKLNVNGGAIALGHPIGASGARVLITLLYEMQRRNAHYGLATLCIGGGQGVAMIVER